MADDSFLLAKQVIANLKKHSFQLAGAESCTGGMVSALLTAVPGASEVFLGSVVSYSNAVKIKTVGVQAEVLETEGAVSLETVSQMLDGVLMLHSDQKRAECAFAVSGVAGPTGGTKEKPVGTVFIGVSVKGRKSIKRFFIQGSRQQIREKSVEIALVMINHAISDIKMLDIMENWEYSNLVIPIKQVNEREHFHR